jgi:methylphosphotriester-DNA--protein-cysteine methyltransferase
MASTAGMVAEPGGRTYTLLGADRCLYRSADPGRFGGQRKSKIYGRLDCPAALRAIGGGGYAAQRVFFADERTAVAAGYRPCAVCLPCAYEAWKAR